MDNFQYVIWQICIYVSHTTSITTKQKHIHKHIKHTHTRTQGKQHHFKDRCINYECCFNMCNVLFLFPSWALGLCFASTPHSLSRGRKKPCHIYDWGRSEVTTALDRTLLRWRCSWTESRVHQSLHSRPIARRAALGSTLHPPRPLRLVLPLAVSLEPSVTVAGPRVSSYLAAERPEHRSAIGFSADRLFFGGAAATFN